MTASIRSLPRYDDLGPGLVEALEDAVIVVGRPGESLRCLNALASLYAPRVGDAVLVSRGSAGEAYVTGVLSRGADAPLATLADGAAVHADANAVSVRDARGNVVFEYRADEGRSVLRAARGDIALEADAGDITLHASRRVRLRADEALEAHTPRAALTALDATVTARALTTTVETARTVAAVIDTTVERAVTRAKNVFEEVEELSQTRAGRVRTLVRGALHVFAKRAVFKADDDVKIKGERIHLG